MLEVYLYLYMDVSKNGGTQQQWVFLLKMIILGCFGGTTIFGNIHIAAPPRVQSWFLKCIIF